MPDTTVFEGYLAVDDASPDSKLLVDVVRVSEVGSFTRVAGKRVRVTVEIFEENETFEQVALGIPPDVIADERDEIES